MTHPLILLFDFDGVIITQKALEYSALIHLRKRFYNWKNVRTLRLIDLARIFEESDSSNRIKAISQAFKAYKKYIPSRIRRLIFFIKFRRLYPKYEKYETLKEGLEKSLMLLSQKNAILGILSNTSKKRMDYFREKLNLAKYFKIIITRDDTPYRKPNPYPILLSLRAIKKIIHQPINKKKVYLIGDLPTDIECAKNAHIKSIALLSGHGRKKDLIMAEPDIILEEIGDLTRKDIFEKLLLD